MVDDMTMRHRESAIWAAGTALSESWPAPDHRDLGGWRLAFGQGFTRRANSVWMLGAAGRDVAAAIGTVEEQYRARGLQARFLATDGSDEAEVAMLTAFGYAPSQRGLILANAHPGDALARIPGHDVSSLAALDDDWLDSWLAWSARRAAGARRLAQQILTSSAASSATAFLRVGTPEAPRALARLTVVGSIGVIDCLATESASRRRGLGAMLLEAAIRRAAELDATTTIAIVVADNAPSLRLFERAGFSTLSRFTYFDAPDRASCC